MVARPCDSCARWYDLGLLHPLDDEGSPILLCPACYEWRTRHEPLPEPEP